MTDLRDTNYATEIARAVREFPDGSEARLERLHVKSRQAEEIRFSWWKDGNLAPRPLDLEEPDLLKLIEDAKEQGVFSEEFLKELKLLICQ